MVQQPPSDRLKTILRFTIPVLIICMATAVILSVEESDIPDEDDEVVSPVTPLLPTMNVSSNIANISIHTQGIITPTNNINITSQVSGKITKINKTFKPGSHFSKGEFLFQIDPRDYELTLTKVQAEVASAEQKLIREQAESKLAKSDWKKYGQGKPSPLTLRLPQMREAQARLDASRAELKKAQLDLARTVYKAPFDGVIKTVSAEAGQFVTSNTTVLEIFSHQKFEIRLPVSRKQLEYLPLSKDGNIEGLVTFTDPQRKDGTGDRKWSGKIRRLEKELLQGTNQYVLVAELQTPDTAPNSPDALLAGTFLHAEIKSKNITDLYQIPRSALYQNDSVLVVDKMDSVTKKAIKILKKHNNYIYIKANFSPITRIITKPPEIFIEGMKIRTNSSGATDMLLSIKELEKREISAGIPVMATDRLVENDHTSATSLSQTGQ